jgi:tetratricopeptide (TPR) repeat protein
VHEQLVHPRGWPYRPTPVLIEHWGYADVWRKQAKGAYYLHILNEMLEDDPEDYYALFQASRCHLNLGQFAEAAERLAKVAASSQARLDNPELWVHAHGLWAQSLVRAGQGQEAVDVLDRLLEEAPEHGLALYQRGRLAYDRQDWPMAVACLGRARERGLGAPVVDLDPDKALFLAEYFLGRSLARLGRPAEAAQALAQALARDPANLAARTDLARALAGLGRRDEARMHLERVLKSRPGDRQAREIMASLEGAQ